MQQLFAVTELAAVWTVSGAVSEVQPPSAAVSSALLPAAASPCPPAAGESPTAAAQTL